MKVDILPTQSKRLTVVRLSLNDVSILLCNVYMQTDISKHIDLYTETLAVISMLCKSTNDDYFIVAGDLNVNFLRPSSNCDLLKSFITDNNLKLVSNFIPNSVDFTFESKGTGSRSLYCE